MQNNQTQFRRELGRLITAAFAVVLEPHQTSNRLFGGVELQSCLRDSILMNAAVQYRQPDS
ncbi:MAG: hypothetical protein ACK5AN_25430, partial [Planctomyces sp.]